MNVLIVDDQIHVVSGIVNGVDWKTLGVETTFTAYSAFEARLVISREKVDILLCDIEMPVENGISLFRWVKLKNYSIECIFLTAHADFSYAQEAIRLGSFDYILQPARYKDIQNAILRAKTRILARDEMARYSAFGKTLAKNRADLLDGVVRSCLVGQKRGVAEAFREIGDLGVSITPGQKVFCVLLEKLKWTEGRDPWENGLLRYAMENMLAELLETYHYKALWTQEGEDFALIFYCQDGSDPEKEIVEKEMGVFVDVSRKEIGVSLACYCSESVCETEVFSQMGVLRKEKMDNVSKRCGIFFSGAKSKERDEYHFGAQLKCWEQMLSSDKAMPVREEIHAWLEHEAKSGGLSANTLKLFYYSLVQMLSVVAEQKEIRLQEYLNDPELLDLYLTAYRSVEEMERLVDYVIPCFQKEQPEDSKRQIDKILQYIYNHIESDLKRTDIAREVFLNPDYMSRMFKKEMGVPLKEFIITEKIKLAKNLLKNTKLPISTVALRVGYKNFSHFSKSYKKVMGLTPEEDRKEKK